MRNCKERSNGEETEDEGITSEKRSRFKGTLEQLLFYCGLWRYFIFLIFSKAWLAISMYICLSLSEKDIIIVRQ